MSYCREEGKDQIIFVTKEDHEQPSTTQIEEDDDEPGLILDNGDINWNCPCLGGMASGPCGYEFRQAFSCFHYSEAEAKGADCYDAFKDMQQCMVKFPDLYDNDNDNDEETIDISNVNIADPDTSPAPEVEAETQKQTEVESKKL